MKFLVDAHLPPSLCAVLARHRHDAIHTLDLPAKNATKDAVLNQISLDERRVIISKDSDFFYSHLVLGRALEARLGQDRKHVHGRYMFSFRASLVGSRSRIGATHTRRN
ncbi:MAG: DUF5615 family PIN-like protein [Candidatus Binatia bacterium]